MILFPNQHPQFPDDWLLVKQTDHDDHCGRIAAGWTSEAFWQRWNQSHFSIALGLHDAGSRRVEEAPLLTPEGIPCDFIHLPLDVHIELHRESVRAACAVSAYAGLLVSMHTVGIHRDRLHIDADTTANHLSEDFTPEVNVFVEEQRVLQSQLRDSLRHSGGSPLSNEHLWNDFKLLEVIDCISIRFIGLGLADRTFSYVPDRSGRQSELALARVGEWEYRVSPFPFKGNRFECPVVARRLAKHKYLNPLEYHEAWCRANLVTLPFACVR